MKVLEEPLKKEFHLKKNLKLNFNELTTLTDLIYAKLFEGLPTHHEYNVVEQRAIGETLKWANLKTFLVSPSLNALMTSVWLL